MCRLHSCPLAVDVHNGHLHKINDAEAPDTSACREGESKGHMANGPWRGYRSIYLTASLQFASVRFASVSFGSARLLDGDFNYPLN